MFVSGSPVALSSGAESFTVLRLPKTAWTELNSIPLSVVVNPIGRGYLSFELKPTNGRYASNIVSGLNLIWFILFD